MTKREEGMSHDEWMIITLLMCGVLWLMGSGIMGKGGGILFALCGLLGSIWYAWYTNMDEKIRQRSVPIRGTIVAEFDERDVPSLLD